MGFLAKLGTMIASLLALLFGSFGLFNRSQISVSTTIPTIPVATSLEISSYRDGKYNFEVTLPKGFYDDGVIDGVYAYNKYFANQDTNGDFTKLQPGGIELSFVISKDESHINNAEALKEMDAIATITDSKKIVVDGQTAIEQFEDDTKVSAGDPGCELATYFMEGNISYQITLFSTDCSVVSNAQEEYDAMLKSFHLSKLVP